MMIYCEEMAYEVIRELSVNLVEAYDELGEEAVLSYCEETMEWEVVG